MYGLQLVPAPVADLLHASGWFTQIVPQKFHVPVGTWHEDPELRALGAQYRDSTTAYAWSMHPILSEWLSDAEATVLVNDYVEEINDVDGMWVTCFTVHARRA